jgi:hypothetical protein
VHILYQFRDPAIPGGHARALATGNCGSAARGIDDNVGKHEPCRATKAFAKDDAAVRRDAGRAQLAECDSGSDSGRAKALVETRPVDHVADPIGMAQEIFIVPFARVADSANPEAAPCDRGIIEQRFKPYRCDRGQRCRCEKLEAVRNRRTRIRDDDGATLESQEARHGGAGRSRSHHEIVGAKRLQVQISPWR